MEQRELLGQWCRGLRVLHRAHFESARQLEQRNLLLGIPAVVLSTTAGTTIFATLESVPDLRIRITVGLLSVAAAVLVSLQTFLRYAERAERHKSAAVRYGILRREAEEALAHCSAGEPCPREFFEKVRQRWDAVDQESPTVPPSIYKRTERLVLAPPTTRSPVA